MTLHKTEIFLLLIPLFLGQEVILKAQQTNLQFLPANSPSFSTETTRDISMSYSGINAPGMRLGGLDLSLSFSKRKMHSASGGSIGTTLFGVVGPGKTKAGATEKDIVGTSLHLRPEFHSFRGKHLSLYVSIPFSAANFDIGTNKKNTASFYNFMSGLQTGAALRADTGSLVLGLCSGFGLMTGYKEIYEGGVYLSNLHSGWISPFVIWEAGFDILEVKKEIKLSLFYQHFFDSPSNGAVNSLNAQFTIGWNGLGQKLRKKT